MAEWNKKELNVPYIVQQYLGGVPCSAIMGLCSSLVL